MAGFRNYPPTSSKKFKSLPPGKRSKFYEDHARSVRDLLEGVCDPRYRRLRELRPLKPRLPGGLLWLQGKEFLISDFNKQPPARGTIGLFRYKEALPPPPSEILSPFLWLLNFLFFSPFKPRSLRQIISLLSWTTSIISHPFKQILAGYLASVRDGAVRHAMMMHKLEIFEHRLFLPGLYGYFDARILY